RYLPTALRESSPIVAAPKFFVLTFAFSFPAFYPIFPQHIRMAEKTKHNYDESKIKTLSSLEHIRLRTGMYIGRIGNGNHYDDGCYILLKEVVDNAIDEYIM